MRPASDPKQYREDLLKYRNRSYTKTLFQGYIYRFLKDILTYDESEFSKLYPDLEEHRIASLSTFQSEPEPRLFNSSFAYGQLQLLKEAPLASEGMGQVLFLQGHLSGSWIAAVGAKYGIAYEFFRRHIHLWYSSIGPVLYAIPNLPSVTMRAGLPLRFYTTGESVKPLKDKVLDSRRIILPETASYGPTALTPAPGSTYVRGQTSLDASHFFLEQDMEIIIQPSGDSWTAIVWSDVGSRDLSHSSVIHRFVDHFTACPKTGLRWILLHPIGVLGHDSVLLRELPTFARGEDPGNTGENAVVQPASHLPDEFHLLLDYAIAAVDPLYALYPIFQFAATTSQSVLTSMVQRYDRISSTKWHPQLSSDNLEQLVLQKSILDDQACRHEEVLFFLNAPQHNAWAAKLTPEQKKVADAAKQGVKDDYAYLIRRCRSFSEHHQSAIATLTTTSGLIEARKQIVLATQVTKLTILASVFLPLSFCTSIFGMNFIELENLRIWIWVVATAVIGVMTVMVYSWGDRDMYAEKIHEKWKHMSSNVVRNWPSKKVSGSSMV